MAPTRDPITIADSRLGRALVRAGYAVILAGVAASVVLSIRAWGETSSLSLVGCLLVLWTGSGIVAYGRKLRGQLPPGAFRVSRGLLSLPFGLGLAYYGPAIEHFGIWWALLLPHLTYGALDSAGLGHWPALALTVVAAPVELLVTVLVSQAVIVSPLSAILGPDNPVVEAVRDLVGGVRVVEDGPLPAAGFHESTVWAGDNSPG